MTLHDYIRQHGLTPLDFAERVGASEHGVAKWVRGERIPGRAMMQRIIKATGGEVTPNDFYSSTEAA